MVIELLPQEIINQIAAGEVIENPAAVIKELIENSIDAQANRIEIWLKNSGIDTIIIEDNGCGIPKEDLIKAPLRHATSKIKTFNDLYSIKTMGFRGEALASIFSVAETVLISKPVNQTSAYSISSEDLSKIKESSGKNGTHIEVKQLFSKTPARKKYLRSENLELKSVLEVIEHFTLIYPQIHFLVHHNESLVINKPIFKTQEENLLYILGKEIQNKYLSVNFEEKGLQIKGFIANPSLLTYSYKKNQFLFVNNRYIKSKLITDAIYQGFGTNLMQGRHPFFIMMITIDPEIIDVNVHPTKIEIKFENELEIHHAFVSAISQLFSKQDLSIEFQKEKTVQKPLIVDTQPIITKPIEKKEQTYFTKEIQRPLQVEQQSIQIHSAPIQEQKKEYGPLYDILKDYRIIGQVNKTYIIIETPQEMLIIDQHVAEEKFFFEYFKEMLKTNKVPVQHLLKPELVTLSIQEKILFQEYKSLLEKLGFIIEDFGKIELLVRATPKTQHILFSPQNIPELLNTIAIDKTFSNLEEKHLEKLASMSCKKSIKAGDELTLPQIRTIIENLKTVKEPFNCPHGRPIILRYSYKELEKMFKRIV